MYQSYKTSRSTIFTPKALQSKFETMNKIENKTFQQKNYMKDRYIIS